MHCRPKQVLPAVVHPTKCCVNHTFTTKVVPHIHPTHTTTVNHTNFEHVHYFPQSFSSVNQVTHQNFAAPPSAVGPAMMGSPGGLGPGSMGPRPPFGCGR